MNFMIFSENGKLQGRNKNIHEPITMLQLLHVAMITTPCNGEVVPSIATMIIQYMAAPGRFLETGQDFESS